MKYNIISLILGMVVAGVVYNLVRFLLMNGLPF